MLGHAGSKLHRSFSHECRAVWQTALRNIPPVATRDEEGKAVSIIHLLGNAKNDGFSTVDFYSAYDFAAGVENMPDLT
jgi:hypothetical protein